MIETLTINGLSMEPPDLGLGRAWQPVDHGYSDFANSPTMRGGDLVIPQARGQRGYERVVDATVVSISMMMFGEVEPDGTLYPGDAYEGLWVNRDYFMAGVTPGEIVTAVFTRGENLPVLTGDVIVLAAADWRLRPQTCLATATFRLDMKILAGYLDEDESA